MASVPSAHVSSFSQSSKINHVSFDARSVFASNQKQTMADFAAHPRSDSQHAAVSWEHKAALSLAASTALFCPSGTPPATELNPRPVHVPVCSLKVVPKIQACQDRFLDLPDDTEVEEYLHSGFAPLADLHESAERGEPLAFLLLTDLADRDHCCAQIADWIHEEVAPMADASVPSDVVSTWKTQLQSHFETAVEKNLSAIEYRLWSVADDRISIDARFLRYTADDVYLLECQQPAWWEK